MARVAGAPGFAKRQSARPDSGRGKRSRKDFRTFSAKPLHFGFPVISARKESAANQRACISTGYPSRGVPAGKLVSIQVKWGGEKTRDVSGSILMPLGVPAI